MEARRFPPTKIIILTATGDNPSLKGKINLINPTDVKVAQAACRGCIPGIVADCTRIDKNGNAKIQISLRKNPTVEEAPTVDSITHYLSTCAHCVAANGFSNEESAT